MTFILWQRGTIISLLLFASESKVVSGVVEVRFNPDCVQEFTLGNNNVYTSSCTFIHFK